MVSTKCNQPTALGWSGTHNGRPCRIVGEEMVGPGDALRRPAGRCLLVRYEDESIEWVGVETKGGAK